MSWRDDWPLFTATLVLVAMLVLAAGCEGSIGTGGGEDEDDAIVVVSGEDTIVIEDDNVVVVNEDNDRCSSGTAHSGGHGCGHSAPAPVSAAACPVTNSSGDVICSCKTMKAGKCGVL